MTTRFIDFECPCGIVLEIEYEGWRDSVELVYVEGITPCGNAVDEHIVDKLLAEHEDDILFDIGSTEWNI